MQKEDIVINKNTQMWMCRPVLMTKSRNTHRLNLYLRLSWLCLFVSWWVAAHRRGRKGAVGGVEISSNSILGLWCQGQALLAQSTICLSRRGRQFCTLMYVCMYVSVEFFCPITNKTGPSPLPFCHIVNSQLNLNEAPSRCRAAASFPSLQRTQQLLHLS